MTGWKRGGLRKSLWKMEDSMEIGNGNEKQRERLSGE